MQLEKEQAVSLLFSRKEARQKTIQTTQLTSSENRKHFFGSCNYSRKANFGDMANVKWKYMVLCSEQKMWYL